MIDIQAELSHDIANITVNGKVSRQFATGVQIVSDLRSSGRLPSIIVVGLGTNGAVTSSLLDAMMAAAQGAQRVVFCTVHVPRSWESGDNAVIRAGVARYPNAALADWHALSQGHAEWFAPDGFHVNATGARAMAGLIASVI
jgi:lysophospholipase L1-like esterase